jgi:hypothetical protein
MAWSPSAPDDFSRFVPGDMMNFLDWFELSYENAIALGLVDGFVEGLTEPYLEVLARGGAVPPWIDTMLRVRLAAQWAYQQQEPLGRRVRRNLAQVIPEDQLVGYAARFRVSPEDIANVPPAVRQSFVEGSRFSLDWIKRLSDDAKGMMRDVMAIESLRNRNPMDAVPILENLLRRDLVAKELGLTPEAVTPAMVQSWLLDTEAKLINELAHRAKMISATESMRMMNLGILTSLEESGDKHAYVMPHANSCEHCRRLIDGRVFPIQTLKENLFANFGKQAKDWIASLPQHPFCRHSAGKVPVRFRRAVAGAVVPAEGIVLEFYGLPGRQVAMDALGLPEVPWLAA